jgi:ubiquinone biosynthesis protein Coq4
MKRLKKIWLGVRFIYAIIRLLLKPKDVSPIFRIKEFLNHKSFECAINQAKTNIQIKEMMDQRYLAKKPYDLDELIQLPEGSVGYVFAKHMKYFKLDVEFYPDDIQDIKENEISWIRQRSRETHDVWHSTLGYKPDHLGEMKISAFYLQQMNSPMSSILLAVGLIYATLKKPHLLNALMEDIITGWSDAKKAKPLMEVKWELIWGESISKVRSGLNISVQQETFEQIKMSELEIIEKTRFENYKKKAIEL